MGFDDVQLEFEGYRYIIECKRPFTDHRFEENLRKAYNQLGKRLKDQKDRAFVAIAIEKMLAIDDAVHEINSTTQARSLAEAQMDQLKTRIITNGTTTDMRIVGFVFVVRFLMHTKTEGLKAINYLFGSMPTHYGDLDPIPEASRLLRLTETLRRKFQSMDSGIL